MFLYLVMAFWSAMALGFNTRLSAMMAQAIAPTGALMTFIALWTGAFWGRPTWGTYWAWDARMTSELILLFLYLGVIALRNAIDDPRRADRACGVLALVGVVNIPIIYFSVQWWNTLHQGSSISLTTAPKMAAIMLTGMLVMSFAAWFYAIAVALARVRTIIVERERGAAWIAAIAGGTQRMSTFFAMNGYGFYVWSAYGVTALALVVELLALRSRRRAVLAEARSDRAGRRDRARGSRRMKPRHRRFAWIGAGVLLLGVAAALVLNAFQSNLVFFFSPTQVAENERRRAARSAIGGLVEEKSLKRARRRPHGALQRHRHREDDSRRLHRHPSRPLQGRQGRRRAGQARPRRRVPRDRGAREARRELHAARGRRRHRPGEGTDGDGKRGQDPEAMTRRTHP